MKELIVIVGPTASGKTGQAIALAKQLNTEIISADSRQMYKELTIGTAKPGVEQLQSVPHHFINTISISQDYNAGMYEMDTLVLLEKLFQRYEQIILTGGSGLYINAVLKGFDKLPDADKEIREHLRKQFETNGIEYLRQQLLERDPEYYKRVDLQNPQRILRALEVCLVTGKSYSSMLHHHTNASPRNFSVKVYGLDLPREELYNRINQRVDKMIEEGLVNEVKNLQPYKHHNALQTVGYKEIFECINENISLQEAIELIKKNTRNYAKRQLTWFRRMEDVIWVEKIM